MGIKLTLFFLIQLKIYFQQNCFDYNQTSNSCHLCQFDYYSNNSLEWEYITDFDPLNCTQKSSINYELEVFVNSSISDCQSIKCDGSYPNPFNDLFKALKSIMFDSMIYSTLTARLYLFGANPHFLYTNESSQDEFFLFRRQMINLTIQPLLCKYKPVIGCFIDDFTVLPIILKQNNILFFISNKMTLRNLKFNGIDMNAFNKITDISTKQAYSKNMLCSESDLIIQNADLTKALCFLNNQSANFSEKAIYGVFNLELLYDAPLNSSTENYFPELNVQNCQFIDLNFINENSVIINSLFNLIQSIPINKLSIENTTINRILCFKGVLTITQKADPFYKYVSVTSLLHNFSINQIFMNIIVSNLTIKEYNFYNKSINIIENNTDDFSIFNLQMNKSTFIYQNLPILALKFAESSTSSLNNDISFLQCFIIISGFNSSSQFNFIGNKVFMISNIFIAYMWDLYALIAINSSIFTNLNDNSFYFHNNNVSFNNNIVSGSIFQANAFIFINGTFINITHCTFNNVSSGKSIISYLIQNWDGLVMLSQIIFENDVFQYFTNTGIINTDLTILGITIHGIIIDTFFLGLNNIFQFGYMNNLLNVTQMTINNVIGGYLFYHASSRSKRITTLKITNSTLCLIFANDYEGDIDVYTILVDIYANNLTLQAGASLLFDFSNWSFEDIIYHDISVMNSSFNNIYGELLQSFWNRNFYSDHVLWNNCSGFHYLRWDYGYSALYPIAMFSNTQMINKGATMVIFYMLGLYFKNCTFNIIVNLFWVQYTIMDNTTLIDNVNDPALIIYFYSNKKILILNCNFINNGYHIYFTFTQKDFDLSTILTQNEDLFYYNYFKYCDSISLTKYSYDYCYNFVQKSNSFMLYIQEIPFFNYSEWISLWFKGFGVINSTFIGALYYSIKLDNAYTSVLMMKNCVFKDVLQKRIEYPLLSASSYNIFLFNVTFQNISFPNGGCLIQFITSNIYMVRAKFHSIYTADEKGSILKLVNSTLIYNNSYLENVTSIVGSFLYSQASYFVNITNSVFNGSKVISHGGYLYADTGVLYIINCTFMQGYSKFSGGTIYLSKMHDFQMINSSLINNYVGKKGNIYIETQGTVETHIFQYVTFINNQGESGSCIYALEAPIMIIDSIFINNTAYDSLIYEKSLLSTFVLFVRNSSFIDNIAVRNIIYISKGNSSFENLSFLNNIFEISLISLFSSNLFISNITFSSSMVSNDTEQQQISKYFIDTEISFIEADFLIFLVHLYAPCIYSLNSTVRINNSQFSECLTAFSVSQYSTIFIDNCEFQRNYAAIHITESTLIGMHNYFNASYGDKGSILYAETAPGLLQINDSSFENINSTSFYIQDYTLQFFNNVFSSKYSINSQVFYLLNIKSLEIMNCSFIDIYAIENIYGTSSYSPIELVNKNEDITKIIAVFISFSRFISCYSINSGGALSLFGYFSLKIHDSSFQNNTAMQDGGAIYFFSYGVDTTNIELINNKFFNNKAIFSGGAMKLYAINTLETFNNNFFINNSAGMGYDVSTYPTKLSLTNDTNSSIFTLNIDTLQGVSGYYVEFTVFILDSLNNSLIGENAGEISIISENTDLKLLFNVKHIFYGNTSFQMYTYGKPDVSYPLIIKYVNGKTAFNQSTTVKLRNCEIGEYETNSQCIQCQQGYFSLNITKPCIVCPRNGFCPGMSLIIPMNGYWRFDEKSSVIIACVNEISCPDQRDNYRINQAFTGNYNLSKPYTYICQIGSYGNLCYNCESGYGLSNEKNCVACAVRSSVIILLIFNFLVLLYQTIKAFDTKSENNESSSRSLMKLIINHNNYLNLLEAFRNIIYNASLVTVLTYNKQINTVGTITDSTIFDCIIQGLVNKESLAITRVVVFSFFPLIVILMLFFIRIILICTPYIKTKMIEKNLLNIIISCFVCVLYSFYPRLVSNAFSLIKCIDLDDSGRTFLEIDPNIQCWQPMHMFYIKSIFVPNFLIWIIGWLIVYFLALFFWKSVKQRKHTSMKYDIQAANTENNPIMDRNSSARVGESATINKKFATQGTNVKFTESVVMNQSEMIKKKMTLSEKEKDEIFQKNKILRFLTQEYDTNYYYWDEFFFGSNLLVILLSLMSNTVTEVIFVEILIFVFLIMLIIVQKTQPFRFKEINSICLFSFSIIIATLYCVANICFIKGEYQAQENTYFVLIFIFNGIFYLFWLYIFLYKQIFEKIVKYSVKFINALRKLREKRKKSVKQ